MANAHGHAVGCTCEQCYLASYPTHRPSTREIAPGISMSQGVREAPTYLLLHCGGFFSEKKIRCRATLEVPLPIEEIAELLLDAGWVASAALPVGAPKNVMSPLCGSCARIIHGDALVAAARQTRRQAPGKA